MAPLLSMAALALATTLTAGQPPTRGRLQVAVTEPDIEAIVAAIGGDSVGTFSLFTGCIVRKDLHVERSVRERLPRADAIIWTGFLNESAAIHEVLPGRSVSSKSSPPPPAWVDVSRGAARVNVPVSTCFGYIDAGLMSGDPFFWLNPQNGPVIARHIANGLSVLRPDKRALYLANAEAFRRALDADIARWKQALQPLAGLRIFSAQCGWQNFARLGGLKFVVCKGDPGTLPTPNILMEHVRSMKADIILLDPNTPHEYGDAFREQSGVPVIEVASSIEHIPGARSYSALFDHLVQALVQCAAGRKPAKS